MILSLPTLKLYKFTLHGYCTTKYSRSSPLAYSAITRSIISKIWDGDCLLQSPMPVDCPFPIHCSTDISYFCSENVVNVFKHLIREVSLHSPSHDPLSPLASLRQVIIRYMYLLRPGIHRHHSIRRKIPRNLYKLF